MTLKDDLIKSGAVKFGNFALSSVATSNIYIDIKQAALNPEILKNIIREIDNIVWYKTDFPYNIDKIVSIAVGGVPLATALSLHSNIPQAIIRKEKREHGVISKLIGDVTNKKCIFIDDVATTGNSIMFGINTIRENGGMCDTAIVVIDREEGATELLTKNGIKLYSCIKKSELL